MNAAAWVLLAAFSVQALLLMIAVGANSDLAAENRRLRALRKIEQSANRAGGAA
mgnify:CR=1 FL=1